jgi:fumiquinazoline A oxidase
MRDWLCQLAITSASCVGMLGATLGAGVSTLQGLHGLLIDSLESVRLVTASGSIATASEMENADLFWGMRGAGYNFGIVTSATYKVYNATNQGQVVNADFLFPPSSNRSVWEMLQSYDTTLPAQLAITIVVGANVTTREVSLFFSIDPYCQSVAHTELCRRP